MTRLATGDIWQATLASLRPRLGDLIAVAAPFTLLVDVVVSLFGPEPPTTLAQLTPRTLLVVGVIPAIIGGIAQLAVARLVAQPDEAPRLALGAALAALPVYLAALVLAALPTGFGFLLFIVPGVYLTARLFLVLPIAAIERPGVVAAITRSWALTAGQGWSIVLFLVLMVLFVFGLTVLAAGVGAALASVLTVVGLKVVGSFVVALLTATVAMLASIGTAAAATVIYLKLR